MCCVEAGIDEENCVMNTSSWTKHHKTAHPTCKCTMQAHVPPPLTQFFDMNEYVTQMADLKAQAIFLVLYFFFNLIRMHHPRSLC